METNTKALVFYWLVSVGPDEWHELAQVWNFDRGILPLNWIVKQPLCDRATAQHIFWDLTPWALLRMSNDSDVGSGYAEEYKLMANIVSRWNSGLFSRSELGINLNLYNGNDPFGPNGDGDEVLALSDAHPSLKVSSDLLCPIEGRVLESADYVDGLPPGVADFIDRIYVTGELAELDERRQKR